MNKDEGFSFTVRWLLGLCLDLAWSGLQAVTFYTGLLNKEMVTHWQLAFSMRELVRTNRISGLAYEPAWLAGQLATTFIPFLFAAVLTNFRITRLKWLEPVLLALSLLVILATYSRGGLLTTAAAAGLTFLFLGRDATRAIWAWFINWLSWTHARCFISCWYDCCNCWFVRSNISFLGQKNFFRRLWEIDAKTLSEYMVDINAGARGAYSAGALAAFEEYPITGVGLGASGFYIYQNLPDWALTTVPEIAKQLNPENRLYPNPKNLYVRLLAETGLIGFFLFIAFQFHILGDMLNLLRHKEAWARLLFVAGVFAWLAITFIISPRLNSTTPNIWLVHGHTGGAAANLDPSTSSGNLCTPKNRGN
jgi:O-antigen ligase